MANPNLHVDRDLDLSNASRGVWLVKVCTTIDFANSMWKINLFISKDRAVRTATEYALDDQSFLHSRVIFS